MEKITGKSNFFFLCYLLLFVSVYVIEHEVSASHFSLRLLMFICTVAAFPLGGEFLPLYGILKVRQLVTEI